MAKDNNLQDFLKGIADVIRYENATSTPINPQEFSDKITGIADKLRNILQGTVTEITPEMLTGITTLRPFAFSGYDTLTKITFPESVTYIGDCAFDGCTSLVKLNLPNGLEQFSSSVFLGPQGMFPESLELNCDDNGFMYLGNETNPYMVLWYGEIYDEGVAFPVDTKIITGGYQIYVGITTLNIPDQIISIETNSLSGDVEVINCGSGLKHIGDDAFYYCDNLQEVNVSESNPFYSSASGVLYDKNKTTFVFVPKKIATAEIPDTITKIPSSAFYGRSLTSIIIPSSVKVIDSSAFYNCTKLTEVSIGEGLITLGSNAFYNCNSLTSITLPNSLKAIGGYAFRACTKLASITIPISVTSMGTYSFYGCTSITSVKYEGNVLFANYLFSNCSKVALYDFRNATAVPTLGATSYLGHATGCKIVVPDDLYDSWTAATNWKALTGVTWVKASEYTEE